MIPAHEFHHARLENLDPRLRFAYRMQRGQGIDGQHDGIVIGNLLAGFSHLRSTAGNDWAARFVAFVRSTRARRHSDAMAQPHLGAHEAPPPAGCRAGSMGDMHGVEESACHTFGKSYAFDLGHIAPGDVQVTSHWGD